MQNDYVSEKSGQLSQQSVEVGVLNKSNNKKRGPSVMYLLLLIAVIPLGFGVWATNTWFKEYNMAKASLNWVKLEGKMLSKEVGPSSGQTGNVTIGQIYCPRVEYEFDYKGETYTWDQLDFTNRSCSGDAKKSERILAQLPEVGEKVDVYLGVQEKRAVLIPGAHGTSYFGISVGIFLLLLGSIIVRIAIR